MQSSIYLYGDLDVETAVLQVELFELKRAKAYKLLSELKPKYNLLDSSQKQKDLEIRVNAIKKAIDFCNDQIDEAKEVLNEEP